MSAAVFDTNVLIDELRGFSVARETLLSFFPRYVSVVAWAEVMSGALSDEQQNAAEGLFTDFVITPLSFDVAQIAVSIRRQRRLKLPDAIILATARHLGCGLVTRNTKDFDATYSEVVIPYTL